MNTSGKDYSNYQKIESHEDRISNLPDDVISKILSWLMTKDAVRTCVLSHNWKHKWTSIYNIDICDDEHNALHTRFITFVDFILFSYKSRIRSFHLVCGRKYDEYHLLKWISTLLSRNVQILHIEAPNCGSVDLPRCLSRCTSLIQLILFFECNLKVPTVNCFQNLKTLCLHHANIHNEQSHNKSPLLLSFPVLEYLQLRYCTWSNTCVVEIRAPALLNFEAWNRKNSKDSDCQVRIYGPKLQIFSSLGGSLALFDIYAPSVSTIHLHHKAPPSDVLRTRSYTILKSFPFLSRLIMSGCTLKALVQFKPVTPPIFGCLWILHVCHAIGVKELMGFLTLSPILKALILSLLPSDSYNSEQVKPLPACMTSSLKLVAINEFSGSQGHVAIGKFFLENAKALEKIVVPDSCMKEPGVTSLRSAIPIKSNCVLYRLSLFRSLEGRETCTLPWACVNDISN